MRRLAGPNGWVCVVVFWSCMAAAGLMTACGDSSGTTDEPDTTDTASPPTDGTDGSLIDTPEGDIVGTLATGDPCTADAACISGLCREFGSAAICTETCTSTCPTGLVCYLAACTPADFCDDSTQQGPGCSGSPCSRCAAEASCLDGGTATERCECQSGFLGDGETCNDIDECSNGSASCGANANCNNIPGSYSCSCAAGYSGDGQSCTNIDECATNTDTCDANADCTDTDGLFTCACRPGFTGDGFSCAASGSGLIGDLSVASPGRWSDDTYAESCQAYRYPSAPHAYAGSTGSGFYTIKPHAGEPEFEVYCDMEHDGGGWTGIDARNANQDFGSALSTEVGSGCQLLGDQPEGHVAGAILCRYDIDVGFAFNSVRADMTILSTAQGNHVSDLTHYNGDWGAIACGSGATGWGDWVMGTAAHSGGVLSLGEANDVNACLLGGAYGTDALIEFRNVDENSMRDTTLRMEFGENGGENEGWKWESGYVFVRDEYEIIGALTQAEPGQWEDGSFAASCHDYRFPTGLYAYFGATGDGYYTIKPKASSPELDVYCDMTTDGGGWTAINTATADTLGSTLTSLSGGSACSVLGSRPQAFGANTVECRWDIDVGFEFNALRTDSLELLALSDTAEAADLTHYNQVWGAASCNERGDVLFGTPNHSGGVLSLGRFDGAGFCAVGNDYANATVLMWDGDQANSSASTTLRLEMGEAGAPQEGWRWDGGRILLRRDVGIGGARTSGDPGGWEDGTYARDCEGYRRPSGHYSYVGSTGSGVYTVDPDGVAPGQPFDVFCDMTSDGGGWTLMGTIAGGDADNWATQFGYWSDTNLLGSLDNVTVDYKGEAWLSMPIDDAEVLFERVYNGSVEAQSVLANGCIGGKRRFYQLFETFDTNLKCGPGAITTLVGSPVGVASASYEEGVGTSALGGSGTNGWCWAGGDNNSNTFRGHLLWNQSTYPTSCLAAGHLGGVGVYNPGTAQYTTADITGTNWLQGTDYTLTSIRLYTR